MAVTDRVTTRQLTRHLLVVTFVFACPAYAAEKAATKPTTRPATTRISETRDQERLLGIRAATVAAYEYAEAYKGAIPTTEQLAKRMKVAAKDFPYRVVPSGALGEHMERVKGDWPEVLIAEKHGGADGKWAFGYVDGLCTIDSPARYRELDNSAALEAIAAASKATTKPSKSH